MLTANDLRSYILDGLPSDHVEVRGMTEDLRDFDVVLSEADVLQAVSLVDHQYSYSPYLSWRTRLLQQRQDIARLCAWYAR